MNVAWSEFKTILDMGGKFKKLNFDDRICIDASHGGVIYHCLINKIKVDKITRTENANMEYTDFMDNYSANESATISVDSTLQAFSSKILDNGAKLYRRKHGFNQVVLANTTASITCNVPYLIAKIDEVEIMNCAILDRIDMRVLDSTTGTYTGTNNQLLNQFGFDVVLPDAYFKDKSNYDAELYQGMQVEIIYTNNSATDTDVGVNFVLHEVVSA